MTFGRRQRTDIDTETARQRRANLIPVENLALDRARRGDFLGEGFKIGFRSSA
jgi:hypothetical protein